MAITNAPWFRNCDSDEYYGICGDERSEPCDGKTRHSFKLFALVRRGENGDDNANLIAAAPVLLSAAEAAIEALTTGESQSVVAVSLLKEAIEKARGQRPQVWNMF